MLHAMIPTAFFATLLRRYLDSLSESPEYVAPSTIGYLGTSAVVATVGMTAYGLARLSQKKTETQIESSEIPTPIIPPKKVSLTRVNRKPTPRKIIRKRHRKDKKWFLKHMRHYKSKYGRQIGKLMNQFLGVPFDEPPSTEPMEQDASDDEDEDDVGVEPVEVFESPPYNGVTDERSDVVGGIEQDCAAPSRDRFEEDDDTEGIVRATSSSLELKNLLRENFETQRKRLCERRDSSGSQQSQSSSGSYKSGCSEDTMIHHIRSSSNRGRLSRGKQRRERPRKKRQQITNTRKTRSGRCYSKSSS